MVKVIRKTLTDINNKETNKTVGAFLMKGTGGRAFCAGGDVKSIWQELTNLVAIDKLRDLGTGKPGRLHTDFFREEYKMNHLLGNSLIPQVSIWDGIVMGGGVGISVLGEFRVASEKCMFAMPETAIGLFPDVGSSAWIPHISINRDSIASALGEAVAATIHDDDGVGLLLGLTGCRLNAMDLLQTGIATHLVHSHRLPELEDALAELDMSIEEPADSRKRIRKILNDFCYSRVGRGELYVAKADAEEGSSPRATATSFAPSMIVQRAASISRCFGSKASSVEEVVERLEGLSKEEGSGGGGEWAKGMLVTMGKMSPTSLKITFEQIRRGRNLPNLQSCLKMEFRMVMACMRSHDFREGIRAVLVDKDEAGPSWNPSSLKEVSSEAVEEYFAPLEDHYEFRDSIELI